MAIIIRPVRADELDQIETIENQADALLIEILRPDRWEPAPTGTTRAAAPGFLLVAQTDAGRLVGFVHVIETDGVAHLEQLAVLPEYGRRGYGRMLTSAAMEEARERGYQRLTLRTYADVPWNAPFYRTMGFSEEEPSTPFHQDLIRTENSLGLDRYGQRIQMGMDLLQGP